MNSLKKIAAISAIVCGIALILTIILTPFAVSNALDFYNELVDKAEASAEEYVIHTDFDSKIKELTIENSGYYGAILIEESPDNAIHILTQDRGFDYIMPDVQIKGNSAVVSFLWQNDPRINEENILQLIASEMLDNYRRWTVIQLPASASLHLSGEYMADLYSAINFKYDGFANYGELSNEMDDWYAAHEVQQKYADYLEHVNDKLNEIRQVRSELSESADAWVDVELFQGYAAPYYHQIKDSRSDLLKRSYNFRKEYGTQPQEELDSVYLEYSRLIEELGAAEKEYDLLSAKVSDARRKLADGEMSENQFSSIADSCYTQQVDIDLTISKLRDKLEAYLTEDILNPENNLPVYPVEYDGYDEYGVPLERPDEIPDTETTTEDVVSSPVVTP